MNNKNEMLPDALREQLELEQLADELERYTEEEGATLLEQNEQLAGDPAYQPPPEARKRLMRQMNRRRPRKPYRKKLFVMVAALAALVLTLNASAIQSAIGNFFIVLREENVSFSWDSEAEDQYIDLTETPAPTLIPSGFAFVDQIVKEDVTKIFWEDKKHNKITYCVYTDSTSVNLDKEDTSLEFVKINDLDGYQIVKDGEITLFWFHSPHWFQISGPERLQDKIMQMAQSVALQKPIEK